MDNAYKSKHEYEKYQEQGGFILPILEVRGCGFDWNRSLVTLASLWDGSFALNYALAMKSIFRIFWKKCKVGFQVWAQLLRSCD